MNTAVRGDDGTSTSASNLGIKIALTLPAVLKLKRVDVLGAAPGKVKKKKKMRLSCRLQPLFQDWL